MQKRIVGFLKKRWVLKTIPILLYAFCILFWWLEEITQAYGNTSLIQMLVISFVLPIYLPYIDYRFLKNFSIGSAMINLFANAFIIIICVAISYLQWGITGGYLLKPDSKTIMLVLLELKIGLSALLVFQTIFGSISFANSKKQRE